MNKLLALAIVFAVSCAESGTSDVEQESIGEATMLEDRTIVLQLRAENKSVTGDAMLTFSPGDKRYEEILQHVSPISPGDSKPVPPWNSDPRK